MRRGVPYGESGSCRATSVARNLMEVAVHPYLVSLLAAEHVNDLQAHAVSARRARRARRAQRGQTATIRAA
jgi:hypothetical protein